jgi:hypothetical protein
VFRLDLGPTPALLICNLRTLTAVFKSESSNARPLADSPIFKKMRPVDTNGMYVHLVLQELGLLYELKQIS